MIVCNTQRADDLRMWAFLRAPTLEHRVVELVAGEGERVVRTSVRGAACLPRVCAHPARIKPALLEPDHKIGDAVAHHDITPTFVLGGRAACYGF
jgi:hypothetical protein